MKWHKKDIFIQVSGEKQIKKAFSASKTENQEAAQGFRRLHEADCQAAQGLGRREKGGNRVGGKY